MLKWFAKASALFVIAGLFINIVAILLSDGSFALTSQNWSLAISVSVVGIIVTAVAMAFGHLRLKSG
jgi:hypothetical protein